jgi:hypothetical protein
MKLKNPEASATGFFNSKFLYKLLIYNNLTTPMLF